MRKIITAMKLTLIGVLVIKYIIINPNIKLIHIMNISILKVKKVQNIIVMRKILKSSTSIRKGITITQITRLMRIELPNKTIFQLMRNHTTLNRNCLLITISHKSLNKG